MKKILLTFAFASLSTLWSEAGTITAAGIDTLTPPGTGGGDIADLDANESGGDGFVIFNSLEEGGNSNQEAWDLNIVSNLPAYISNLDGLGSTSSGGWAGYDSIILGGTTYDSGGINLASGGGTETALFSFELAAAAPASITVGLLTDNSDGLGWACSTIRIEGPEAVSADQSIVPDGASDLLNFTIDGGVTGETYTVYGTSAGSGSMIAAATFDSNSPLVGLKVTDIVVTEDNSIELTWTSEPGKSYAVEASTDLESWVDLLTEIDAAVSPATVTTVIVDTPAATETKKHYRLREE